MPVAKVQDADRAVLVCQEESAPAVRRRHHLFLRTFGAGHAVFIGVLALICGLAAYVGVAPMRLYEHDIFFFLDNAYRVAQGQVPHRDFSSAFGPVMYLIDAAGLYLSGMRPAGIGSANALFGALISIWAFVIARNRLHSVRACLLGIYTALLITAPSSLGWGALNFTPAMTYNRYGFALLGIILVECAAHTLNPEREGRRGITGALSTGSAWALLAFLKISYGLMAVPFILIAGGFGAARRRRLAALCGAFAMVTALMMCYLRFDLTDMVRDLTMAASARNVAWQPRQIFTLGFRQLMEVFPLLLLALAVSGGKKLASWSDVTVRACLIAAATLVVGGALLSTNNQGGSLPLNTFAALVLAHAAMGRFKGGSGSGITMEAILIGFLTAVCLLPLSISNGISLVAAALERYRPSVAAEVRLASDRGASMIFAPVVTPMTTETGGSAYVNALNDGVALLRRHTGSRDGVLAIDMLNPFNYLLDRPSPRGGLASAAYNCTYSDTAHPSVDRFFGDARYVIARKYSRTADDYAGENGHIEGLRRTYGPALQQRFRLIEETEHWQLYGRN